MTSLVLSLLLLILLVIVPFVADEARTKATKPVTLFTLLDSGRVQPFKIIHHSYVAKLARTVSLDSIYSITVWNRVYVWSDHLNQAGRRHEAQHVRQWHRYGPLGFVVRYLWDLLRRGYKYSVLEEEARFAAREPFTRR